MTTEAKEAAVPRLRATGPIRITLPAKIAYDPGALKESIASVVERLGCPRCFSGANCLFQVEREFVVDQARKAGPLPDPWLALAGSNPMPGLTHQVTVGMARPVKYDLDKVFKAVDRVIDLIGPHPCISGFDVLFKDEMIVVNERLEAQRF
jgi:hypothetical protein